MKSQLTHVMDWQASRAERHRCMGWGPVCALTILALGNTFLGEGSIAQPCVLTNEL